MLIRKDQKIRKGFSLLEIILSLGIFLIFALGIYAGIQFMLKVVYQSRIRIIETSILNEEIESIRNMSFYDVGIVNGSPSGILSRNVSQMRDGIYFNITRTIRNIDDSFDGTIGGNPNDTSPADYKLVEIEVICADCSQNNPLLMTTYIAPKNLEGDPTHGALFIGVYDANAFPVPQASVHIISTSTSPNIDFEDTTDNEGMLRIVDLPSGVEAYQIIVTKDGYTTDQTMKSDGGTPEKPPATVIAQSVNSVSFFIDKLSSITVNTVNNLCDPVGNISLNFYGTKKISTDPDLLKVDQNIATESSGEITLNNLDWDSYYFKALNNDIVGSIAILPINLLPGSDQPVDLVVGSNTENSLLVHVKDSSTGQPIPNATVILSKANYSEEKITGVGHIRQTDWSFGGGQEIMTDPKKYWDDNGSVEVQESAGDIKLLKSGEEYLSNAELESSIFDLGQTVNYVNLVWEPLSQPQEVGNNAIRFQIATSNTTTSETWNYLGPDNTNSSYYDADNTAVNAANNSNRYFRYKLFLQTSSTTYTPVVSDVLLSYTNSCSPPGQVYFGDLDSGNYSLEIIANGYQTSSSSVDIGGDIFDVIELVQ